MKRRTVPEPLNLIVKYPQLPLVEKVAHRSLHGIPLLPGIPHLPGIFPEVASRSVLHGRDVAGPVGIRGTVTANQSESMPQAGRHQMQW